MSGPPAFKPRVRLRTLLPDEAPSMEPWLAEAVASLDGGRPGPATAANVSAFLELAAQRWPDGTPLAVELVSGGVIGLLVWQRLALEVGEATVIAALATRRDQRNLGYGAEAVYELEQAQPGAAVLAATPRHNGLAIYFWLRAGFRPVSMEFDAGLAVDPAHFWLVDGETLSGSGASSAR